MKLLALILFAPVSTVWRGYVLCKLWLWFIVTTFGANPLSLPQAIGLSSVVSFLTFQVNHDARQDKSDTEKTVEIIIFGALYPACALFAGWIVCGLM